MGFFKKLTEKLKGKKTVAKEVSKKVKENQIASQSKFDLCLKKSSSGIKAAIDEFSKSLVRVDELLEEKIEELLLSLDIGTQATYKLLDAIVDEIKYQKSLNPKVIRQIIVDKLFLYYIQDTIVDNSLNLTEGESNVILVVGANGVGKTTTIAKLTALFRKEGKKVSLVAGDTFRAGAVEQLKIWAEKLKVPIVTSDNKTTDPAAVIYKGVEAGFKRKDDIIICDTSGRLQSKVNLMNELKKIDNVIKKFKPDQPCETLLVLDATTGQSGIAQAKGFNEVAKISGLILTKMDSTSAGGIILAIKDAFNIPVKYVGLGEGINDLSLFDIEKFVDGLVSQFEWKN